MGNKIHPFGIRLGIIYDWKSNWATRSKYDYRKFIAADRKIRDLILDKYKEGGISDVLIERKTENVTNVNIVTARPGVIIGRGGAAITELKELLERKLQGKFEVNVEEIHKPEIVARVVAESVAAQISNRISYRRAAKQAISKALERGAEGIKVSVGGRLNGADIARTEFFSEGKIPLQTLRADVDYAQVYSPTTYGQIGVTVWIYRGLIFSKDREEQQAAVKK